MKKENALNNSTAPRYKLILCDYINPISDKSCTFVRNGSMLLVRSGDGYKIKALSRNQKTNLKQVEIVDRRGMLALPGFFDMHFHWVQDDVRLKPKASLLTWLSQFTWPYEAKFKSVHYSQKRAKNFAKELLEVGTLGGAVYASIHGHTVDHALKYFTGDFTVGNVLMTMNSPQYLTQTRANALALIRNKGGKFKQHYALTPRFAPTTHPEVMKEGAKMARKNRNFIQSHLCETKEEIDYVVELYRKIKGFEKIKSYTEVYHKCGILGKRTIMGHGIHFTRDEWKLLKKTGTLLAHCPTSNAPVKEHGLGSGLFDFKQAERHGISWALATDIGGGPFLSMFDVMRSFVSQNKKAGVSGATYVKALYRATLAGARMLRLEKTHGSLDNGKWGNFIFVKAPKQYGRSAENVLKNLIDQKAQHRSQYQNYVQETWYKGKQVWRR